MCDFNDFRVKRQIIDSFKEQKIKRADDPLVLIGLIRELVFKSTKLLPTHSYEELLRYDNSMHKLASMQNLFSFHRVYAVNKGPFTCPIKSFFIFGHNQDNIDLKNHPLVKHLKNIQNVPQLLNLIKEAKEDKDPMYSDLA